MLCSFFWIVLEIFSEIFLLILSSKCVGVFVSLALDEDLEQSSNGLHNKVLDLHQIMHRGSVPDLCNAFLKTNTDNCLSGSLLRIRRTVVMPSQNNKKKHSQQRRSEEAQ